MAVAIRPKQRQKVVATAGNSHIPHEIVFAILTRVPSAKSLLRFCCVSKSFRSLISQPSFIEAHHKGSLNHLLVTFPYNSCETFITSDLEHKKNDDPLVFSLFNYLNKPCFSKFNNLESINGLFCLWNDHGNVAICNPFTKQHVFLPGPIEKVDERIVLTCCSLGFDPTTKKHKILWAQRTSKETERRYWNIFTLGVDTSWREIQCSFRFFPIRDNCVHIDGVIYSINYYEYGQDDYHIGAFNVGEENFRMIAFPPGISTFLSTIVEIKGEVAILHHEHIKRDGKILMYVLNNGSCEKTICVKKQIIELPPKLYNIKETFMHCRFTSTLKGEIVLIPSFKFNSSIMELRYSFLYFYDMEKKEWIKFKLCGIGIRNFLEVRNGVWCNVAENIWSLK
ncbi:hypothetical protein HAX54_010519 [Datura stramonium]|uniref:F-box domain-containing protein n=1 Tax=Datura stramonium TaxID=4076 RepID=A0ABS8THS7_DATST|nr:hypothetical protein [Datura stramonium]